MAYGLKLEDRPALVKCWQVPPKKRRKLVFENQYKPHNYRPWHSQGTLNTLTFTGWAKWLAAIKVVDVWGVLITVS